MENWNGASLNELVTIRRRLNTLAVIECQRYLREVLSDAKYADPKRLDAHGFKIFSQNDEDGIVQEIFNRIGTVSRIFVEFGVESGVESNTLKLLLEGWEGLWLEGSAGYVSLIRQKFADVIQAGRLKIQHAFIDRDNINDLIGEHYQGEIDLISIDIDGNDFYIFETLVVVRPRVVIIEYNGKLRPPISVVQRYDPDFRWSGTDYGGASLAAVVKLGSRKGYSLVGCNVVGVNAFLVRNDLLGDLFCAPFTAGNHYHPARYFLWQTFVSGHPPDWGPYETV